MKKQKTIQGFSLAEILVYVAIFSAMSVVVIQAYIVITSSFSATRTARDLLESGSTAMERISREVRQASSIDTANSTFGSNPGVLALMSTDSGGASETVKFSTASGALNLYYNGSLVSNLLGQNISVTNLVFRRIVTVKGEAVKVEMTLTDTRSKNAPTELFYDTIILRGEY